MKSFLFTLVLCLAASCPSIAQITDASVCDILANPQSFDGKIVRVKGTVAAGFDEFVIKGSGCGQPVNAIWLAYPEGTKAKAGPLAVVQLQLGRNNSAPAANANRASVKLDQNQDFQQFDSLLSTPYKSHGMCLGCGRYTVTATLVGRLDGTKNPGLMRDAGGKVSAVNGFGNLNQYSARLVLQSVSEVKSQEINYSSAEATKGDSGVSSGGSDPFATVRQATKAFPAGSSSQSLLERAAAAFGEPGASNGVEVGFGTPNQVPENDAAKGAHDSPDGLLFNCTFDSDRLKGAAMSRAIGHVGTEIADVRNPQAGSADPGLYHFEYRAWATTVLSGLAFGQKTLTAPGGYVLWNSNWPSADRSRMMNEAISKFLTEWGSLAKS